MFFERGTDYRLISKEGEILSHLSICFNINDGRWIKRKTLRGERSYFFSVRCVCGWERLLIPLPHCLREGEASQFSIFPSSYGISSRVDLLVLFRRLEIR